MRTLTLGFVAGLALALATALAISPQEAQAATCGGLLQPPCKTASGAYCGGLLLPACPVSTTGTGTDKGTSTSGGCGGLLQPRCPKVSKRQCDDGVDNDKDGQRDLADAGCASAADRNEYDDLAPDANGLPRGADVDPRTSGRLFGFNSVLGMWDSGITVDQEAELIRAAGGNAQRIGITWSNIEPARGQIHTRRFSETDRAYAALVARGMLPLITVLDTPVWASDIATCAFLDWRCMQARQNPPAHLPPKDIEAYASFVRLVSDRYPLAAIETWNEPNIQRFWHYSRFPDARRMADMQCSAQAAVHASDPNRIVTSPGFSMIRSGPASGQIPYVDYVDAMHGHMGGTCWDALSVHLYPTSEVDGDGGSIALGIRAIKAVRSRAGDTTPIWITETGASTTGGLGGDDGHTQRSDAEQRDMVRWTVNELLTTPDVGAVFVHSLREKSHPTSDHHAGSYRYGFGMLLNEPGPTPSPKPVWCHLVGVTQAAYPGCVNGAMTARASSLRSRSLKADATARAMTRRMQRRR